MPRYPMDDVLKACQCKLETHGLSPCKAKAIAEVLLFGEVTGSRTHGLGLLEPYLNALTDGKMASEGEHVVLSDFQACQVWDGRHLPGAWLMQQAIESAMQRASTFGVAVVAVQNSHHTGCLAAFLGRATSRGFVVSIALTDPSHSSVAPWGGTTAVLTSNPVAFGAPGEAGPVWVDMATSSVTNGAVMQKLNSEERFTSEVLQDGYGEATNNPAVMQAQPAGTILPLGGKDSGHKGYALGVMVEILAGCLSGGGRAGQHSGWGASFCVTLYSPALICGETAWEKQIAALEQLCRSASPRYPQTPVRLPGERAWKALQYARQHGVELDPTCYSWL